MAGLGNNTALLGRGIGVGGGLKAMQYLFYHLSRARLCTAEQAHGQPASQRGGALAALACSCFWLFLVVHFEWHTGSFSISDVTAGFYSTAPRVLLDACARRIA
jgi:hypothetical protein